MYKQQYLNYEKQLFLLGFYWIYLETIISLYSVCLLYVVYSWWEYRNYIGANSRVCV